MRDPMSWAIPLFRAFGIPVKVHLFFFIITLGFFLRQVTLEGNIVWWGDVLLFTVVLLFGIVLVHEFGHCFGGRWVGGEANEVLIWPLGGLAYVDVPHHWKAHTITAAAGPAVNVVLCLLCTFVLAAFGFLPNANPLPWSNNPYVSEMKNFRDGRLYTSDYGLRLYRPGSSDEVRMPELASKLGNATELNDAIIKTNGAVERAKAPTVLVWVNRTFWLSWILLLFNLLPAFPLDGGQIMQGLIWSKSGYRQGTAIASYAGYGVGAVFLIASIAINEALLLGLGAFMLFSSWAKLRSLEAEEGLYGDFSQGYTSLEGEEPAPRRPKKGNFVKRWLQARTARRLQREIEERQLEDERMDQLLDKIARFGKESLTDEERRFMARVSERYRNRS
jgi:Zn-dependent protease